MLAGACSGILWPLGILSYIWTTENYFYSSPAAIILDYALLATILRLCSDLLVEALIRWCGYLIYELLEVVGRCFSGGLIVVKLDWWFVYWV